MTLDIRITLYCGFLLLFYGCLQKQSQSEVPNIIFFLADDLGYGEVGIYGQRKIYTPNIDALGRDGMIFTQHYSGSPVCAPSRCVLLTGLHTGHAFIRGNDEWKERGDVWNYEKASMEPGLEGQRPLPSETITLGTLLKGAGYTTGIFGKWGLGAPESTGVPNRQGFDQFYGYNCQRQAHNLYPPHLWNNNAKERLDNELVKPHVRLDSLANPLLESSYDLFTQQEYAPEKIQEKALQFIRDNKTNPFFLYYASPLPHLPLQAPQQFVEQYKGSFEVEKAYVGDKGYFPNQHPRATYAAMISYLDFQLGELIEELKRMGLYKNTVIIFSSDNGPTYTGGVDFDYFESSKPFSKGYGRTKGFVYEGGIRVPLIVAWPNRVEAGSRSDHISAFYDLMPTICDIVGISPPPNLDGISFKAELLNKEQKAHSHLYWEFPSYKGQQAVRMGKWKGVRKNIFEGNMDIELYNLEDDVKEENDLSKQFPKIVNKMEEIMKEEHVPSENDRFKFKELGD